MGWGYKASGELMKTIVGIYRELEDYQRRIIALELEMKDQIELSWRHEARIEWLEQNHG